MYIYQLKCFKQTVPTLIKIAYMTPDNMSLKGKCQVIKKYNIKDR